ncbi:MAG TPA: hypothetical protein VMM13_11100, partial [Euzebya sp.]|nr:hypothetical protein [Euzebya sp.]
QLKTRVGGDVLHLSVADRTRTIEAALVLAPLGTEAPRSDEFTGDIQLPTTHGAQALIEAVRRLDEAGIDVADLALRRPTLDEVFLTLTGSPAAEVEADDPAPTRRRGRGRRDTARSAA